MYSRKLFGYTPLLRPHSQPYSIVLTALLLGYSYNIAAQDGETAKLVKTSAQFNASDRCDFSAYRPVRIRQFHPRSIIKRVEPGYPPAAVQKRIQGGVTVKTLINENGIAEKACAVDGEYLLRGAAEAAALQWKFKPKYGLASIRPQTKTRKNFAEAYIVFDFRLDESARHYDPALASRRSSAGASVVKQTSLPLRWIGRRVTSALVDAVTDSPETVDDKLTGGREPSNPDISQSQLITFLKTNAELQKDFSSRFKNEFRQIPADLRAELQATFPEYRFSIARMEVLVDPPANEYDLILIANAKTAEIAFVWGHYWTLPPSSQFEQILKGHRASSMDEALRQVRTLARLITYVSNDRVGNATAEKGRLTADLLKGDVVFRQLVVRMDNKFKFGRMSITKPRGKEARYFVRQSTPNDIHGESNSVEKLGAVASTRNTRLTFEGTVMKVGERPSLSCGVMAVYRLAKYRVDRVLQGEYNGSEIIVDHLDCTREVLTDVRAGDRVVVVSQEGKVLQRWNAKGIRNQSDRVKKFYLGLSVTRTPPNPALSNAKLRSQ